MHENFMACNRYIPSSTTTIDLDFHLKGKMEYQWEA